MEPTYTITPGLSLFSPSEICVVVVPVGSVPATVLPRYHSLIARHRQVELQLVRSFYKEQQKSPFKFLPWKNGALHFRFIPVDKAQQGSVLADLHKHRNVLGVIGLCHCPSVRSIGASYEEFEQLCRAYPEAFTLRCFAFQPSDKQVEEDKTDKKHLLMFPPAPAPAEDGGLQSLESHAEVVMLDFAASLLAELERWMLTASPAMVDLSSFCDTSDKFVAPTSVVEEVQRRLHTDEEMQRKRRYGRLQKAMGDISLLAGSPSDAADHYATALELARTSSDAVWAGAALEGIASAKVLDACLSSGALRSLSLPAIDSPPESPPRNSKIAQLQAQEAATATSSVASHASSGFGGSAFWAALREVEDLERDVRDLLGEARQILRRRGALSLLVEQDLAYARLLAGLHGVRARHEVAELVGFLVETGAGLPLSEDKLTTIMEAAQVMGLVGSTRKRILLLWQAVEFSRSCARPNLATLQIARKALEPAEDSLDADKPPLDVLRLLPAGVPSHWSVVRCGCVEGVLATAILAGQHADVWDAAALLLREHSRDLSAARQEALQQTLEAAAKQMSAEERQRPGPGPPPLLAFVRALSLAPALRPCPVAVVPSDGSSSEGLEAGHLPGSISPFIYNPNRDKVKAREAGAAGGEGVAVWVAGEAASVEVEISNPTANAIKVEKLTLEAEHLADASVPPRDQASCGKPSWKPNAVAMWLPADTSPTKVILTGVPLGKGLLTLTGCRLTALGVTWKQPWTPLVGTMQASSSSGSQEAAGLAQARVNVVDSLPLMEARLDVAAARVSVPADMHASSVAGEASKGAASPASVTTTEVASLRGQVLQCRLIAANAGRMLVQGAAMEAGLCGAEEEANLRVSLSYSAQPSTDSKPLGRCLALPLHLHVLPSLQVVAVTFHEHYEPARGAPQHAELAVGTEHLQAARRSRSAERLSLASLAEIDEAAAAGATGCLSALRRCVLEIEVINHSGVALQAWLGRRAAPALGSPAWQAVLSSPRPWEARRSGAPLHAHCSIVSPHQRAMVAAIIDAATPESDKLASRLASLCRLPGEGSDPDGVGGLARWLCAYYSLYWRREDLHDPAASMEVGVLLLPPAMVADALRPEAVALLRERPLQLSFQADVASGTGRPDEEGAMREVLAAGEELGAGSSAHGALWGVCAVVGEPMQLSMQVQNRADASCTLEASVACHAATVPPTYDRPAMDSSVLACGVVSGVHLNEAEAPRHLKRKGDGRTSSRSSKRPAPSVRAPALGTSPKEECRLKEECRSVVKALLSSFDGLTGHGTTPEAAEDAFQHLLAVATGDGCAARRIAARLLAKHGDAHPAKLGATLNALIELSKQEPKAGDPPLVEAASRRDALQGLGRLCGAVSACVADDLVVSTTDYLLRRSQRVHEKQAKAGMEAAASMDSTHAWTEPPASEAVCITASLEAAFCASPQAVLAKCLKALEKGQGELCGGARHLLTRNLLSSKSQQSSAADAAGLGCLAARVLAPREDVQMWLRNQITRFKSQGVSGKRADEVAHILDRLLKLAARLPPLPSSPPDEVPALSRRDAQAQRTSKGTREWSPLPPLGLSTMQGLALPLPCGDVSAASGTLWLSGLSLRVSGAALAAECAQYGKVERVVVLPSSSDGQAFVAFPDIMEAAICYESLGTSGVCGSRPLQVKFSAPIAGAGGAAVPAPPIPAFRPLREAGPDTPRTLWVGQVGPDIPEEDLVSAFRRFGTLTGWRVLRRSHCAFIDFQSGVAAAAARDALHGAVFGPWQLRIEFREEGHPMGRGGMPPARWR
ncbi:hypothetical protein WJX81_002340 [Elliptochloris bilobata]|uniref:RRM domain-containing protein n=1 Tax=Elliptochloris bilobata TaxID=381761 RepID=A0AAW1RTN6_9CHLO